MVVRNHVEESDGQGIVRGQRAQAQDSEPKGDGNGQIIPAGPAQRDAMLENLVMQAVKRLDQPPRDESQIGPETSFIDKMAQATARRTSFLGAKSSTAEEAAASDAPKPANPAIGADSNLPGLEIVLGASGSETIAHVGFLKALEDNDVPVGRITGVSGGSLVATLYANGFKADQIKDILSSDQFKYPRIDVLAKCFHVMDPWNLFPYAMDFKPWLKDFVDTYHLKPQPNLRLVAADKITHAPIIFENMATVEDLVTGLAASTAATPGLGLKPVEVNGREAIDGFYYHPTPVALSRAPAIASKIGFVRELPSEPLAPWDYFMHLREMAYYNDFKDRFPDPPGHIIAQTGLPDVATTTFNLNKETTEKLIQHGYDATNERLHQPDAIKAIEEARKNSQN